MRTIKEQLSSFKLKGNQVEGKIQKNAKLNKSQVKNVKQLLKQGFSRAEIARQTGHNYHQVVYCLLKQGIRYKKGSAPKKHVAASGEKDYKQLYFKAMALLVENGIIKVSL